MVELDQAFKPSPRFKGLYMIYLLLTVVFLFLWWWIPLIVFAIFYPSLVILTAIISAILLFIILFTLYWISKYWESIEYTLTPIEMNWHHGVWFRRTGIVPYNRITNVDISQGPISRALGMSHLGIQTAGYTGGSQGGGRIPAILISGIEDSEGLRDQVMSFVHGRGPQATETHFGPGEDHLRSEVTRIRELLEEISKR